MIPRNAGENKSRGFEFLTLVEEIGQSFEADHVEKVVASIRFLVRKGT